MNHELRFAAPWSLAVKIITLVALAVLLGTSLAGMRALPDSTPAAIQALMVFVPLIIILATLPFAVRGYVLTEGELRIERVGWQNRIPLTDVVSATADPQAMRWSIRLFGSGGLFGFFGWFRNRTLGTYRAYGTDPKNTVVVKLRQRTLVVTPDDPARFVEGINSRRIARQAGASF